MERTREHRPRSLTIPTDDGETLHALVEGEGPVLLVLCSIGAECQRRWMPSAFAEHFRLVHLDLRGAGDSTSDPATLDFDRLAADFDAIRQTLGVERTTVFGHSILGMLALELARRRPDSVEGVVTVGTPPYGDMARVGAEADALFEEDASAERRGILKANLAALPVDASPREGLLAMTPRRFFDPRFDAASLMTGAVARPEFFQHLLGPLAAGWNVLDDPRPIRVPALLTHGRADFTVPLRLWDQVVDRLPGAELWVFERSGHQPFVEEPDRFFDAVVDWRERTAS
jgi:proline iminopeptidase